MRKIILFISIACATLSFHSCADFLDVDKYFYDMLSVDSAFSKKVYVEGWLANNYDYLCEADLSPYGSMFQWASDDLVHPDGKSLQQCNYSANKFPHGDFDKHLRRCYECIRKASTFIEKVPECKELTLEEISDMQGQARFLRAFAYFSLIQTYGPVPLIPESGLDVSLSYEELSLPRAKFDEVVDFIDRDLAMAARTLLSSRAQNNFGRPTKGAALALRARVLLFAASPMSNGNKDFYNIRNLDGTVLYNQEYDESKWARAAAAAEDVINLNKYELHVVAPDPKNPYSVTPPEHPEYSHLDFPNGWQNVDPYSSYKYIFDGTIRGSKNPELIFTRTGVYSGYGIQERWNKKSMPRTSGGDNRLAVTQKMVDTYYMDNGKTIDEAGNYYIKEGFTVTAKEPEMGVGALFMGPNVSKMYGRREPRFYASVAFNGAIWDCESTSKIAEKNYQCWYYQDEFNGKEGYKTHLPLTGIGLKKYTNKEDSWSEGGYCTSKTEPTIRYAETLLIHAEALNELTSGKTYTITTYNDQEVQITRDVTKIRNSMKPIRMRAGLPDFDDATYNDPANFRVALKRERHIELFTENSFRYFDLRRWKDAEVEEAGPLMGCDIDVTMANDVRQEYYIPTPVSYIQKVFLRKMYLFPFPQAELKRNVNLTQNPEW